MQIRMVMNVCVATIKIRYSKNYPEFLRKAGYYCTNNDKTDYNTSSIDPAKIWDESSNKAHY